MTKILKIGGSILTDKNKPCSIRPDQLTRVAEEIASTPDNLVLVHGAGSFGHIPAKKFGLPESFSRNGLLETHQSVVKLNEMVVNSLRDAGVSPLPIHPLSCILLNNGRLEKFETAPIVKMIAHGIIPVLHGDVAMDIVGRSGIVSGDQLVNHLGKVLQAEIVAVGTDVDGVLYMGRIVTDVSREDLGHIDEELEGSAGVDVTGGMRGKLMELLELADNGISSIIFNANKKGNIVRALNGESIGTFVRHSK